MVNTRQAARKQSSGTFSVRLAEDTREKIDKLAAVTRRSRSFLINEAVNSYVTERAAYVAELEAALQSAKRGPTHSSEQIFAWMRSWGTENELPEPEPDILKPAK